MCNTHIHTKLEFLLKISGFCYVVLAAKDHMASLHSIDQVKHILPSTIVRRTPKLPITASVSVDDGLSAVKSITI